MKKVLMILVATVMALSLISCQATPQTPIVVGKNQEKMIEQAQNNQEGHVIEEMDAPTELIYSKTKDKITISADAEVELPQSETLPVISVDAANFSQELVDKLCSSLLGDVKLYDASEMQYSQASIEREIIMLRTAISEAQEGGDVDAVEQYLQSIEELEDMYDSAPENTNLPESTGKLSVVTLENGYTYEHMLATDQTGEISVNVINNAMSADESERYSGALFEYSNLDNTGENAETAANSKLTIEEASAVVTDFLAENDLPFGISDIKRLEGVSGQFSYQVQCARLVSGVPCSIVVGRSESDGYSKGWGYEIMNFTVNEQGIANFRWESPYDIIETEVENSKLLSFSDIRSVFETMIWVVHEGQFVGSGETEMKFDVDIKINDVTLELMRVMRQNSIEQGFLVPYWQFSGSININGEEVPSELLLSINAIDGSIISDVKSSTETQK